MTKDLGPPRNKWTFYVDRLYEAVAFIW